MKKITIHVLLVLFITVTFALHARGKSSNPFNKQVNIGKPINNGFFFFNGQYVSLPYIVERKGFKLLINDKTILKWKPIIEKKEYSGDINPKLPISITEKSSKYDTDVKKYLSECVQFVHKKYQPKQFSKELAKLVEKLPFVTKVKIFDTYKILIQTKQDPNNDIISNFNPDFSKRMFKTNKEKLKSIDNAKQAYEKAFNEGNCVFISDNSPEMRTNKHPDDWRNIIQILNSKDIPEMKIEELNKLDFFIQDINKDLVEHYQFSKQLTNRVEVLYRKWKKEHPEEYKEYEHQKRKKPFRELYLTKLHEIKDKGEEYWEQHKDEFEKELKELEQLKAQVNQIK